MNVCVIPARGGSKRIPRKNINLFHGKPMIAWSIAAAHDCGLFDKVVVSTDDHEIAEIARAAGAEVPFMRPKELSNDYTATLPVIAHAVGALGIADAIPICCLYATAPFIQTNDLAEGLRLLNSKATYTIAVTKFDYPIQRALKRDHNGKITMVHPENMHARSQDLQSTWHDAGQFYWALASTWTSNIPVFGVGAHGVILPSTRVVDIDTPEDWIIAEALFRVLNQ